MRVCLEETTRKDVNLQKEDWELFFNFSMEAAKMDPNKKKSSVMAMEVKPVTVTYPKCWKWAYQRLNARLVKNPA